MKDKTMLDETDRKIVSLLADGLSHKEIAQTMYLSEVAIRKRTQLLRERHDCRNTTHLVAKLAIQGITISE